MKEETIECPMKVMDIFPYGKVLVPDMKKLKEKIKYIQMRKEVGIKSGSHKTSYPSQQDRKDKNVLLEEDRK